MRAMRYNGFKSDDKMENNWMKQNDERKILNTEKTV
jgi:hypothetical protein